jgi:hypothetical protein
MLPIGVTPPERVATSETGERTVAVAGVAVVVMVGMTAPTSTCSAGSAHEVGSPARLLVSPE